MVFSFSCGVTNIYIYALIYIHHVNVGIIVVIEMCVNAMKKEVKNEIKVRTVM